MAFVSEVVILVILVTAALTKMQTNEPPTVGSILPSKIVGVLFGFERDREVKPGGTRI